MFDKLFRSAAYCSEWLLYDKGAFFYCNVFVFSAGNPIVYTSKRFDIMNSINRETLGSLYNCINSKNLYSNSNCTNPSDIYSLYTLQNSHNLINAIYNRFDLKNLVLIRKKSETSAYLIEKLKNLLDKENVELLAVPYLLKPAFLHREMPTFDNRVLHVSLLRTANYTETLLSDAIRDINFWPIFSDIYHEFNRRTDYKILEETQ